MPKLLMLKGLPGSGKSTHARELVAKHQYTRVNKDDLRAMLHNSVHSKHKEQTVLAIRDAIVMEALEKGSNVVVDDTNFAPVHEARLRDLAKSFDAQFESKFIDTPVEACIERDLKRPNSVGHKVILQMHAQYLKPNPVVYEPPHGKPRAIICDIDGTIAHMCERSPYDWHKVGTDTPDKIIIDLLRRHDDRVIILLSGRDEVCRPETAEWLAENRVPFNHLYMRPEGDTRKDSIVKRELFDSYIRDAFNVEFVLDDRNQVVEMWRNELGLKVLQVAAGDF